MFLVPEQVVIWQVRRLLLICNKVLCNSEWRLNAADYYYT